MDAEELFDLLDPSQESLWRVTVVSPNGEVRHYEGTERELDRWLIRTIIRIQGFRSMTILELKQ